MTNLILFNKPFGVVSQFSDLDDKVTLKKYIQTKGFYPAGRLDHDSEGLLLLTNNGKLQARIANPRFKMPKTYWVQVDGAISQEAISQLSQGVKLKDGMTRKAEVMAIDAPDLPPRQPPIRTRKHIPTSWLSITISEGKNRQVRRMTANVGYPTLRLFRQSIGSWNVDQIKAGSYSALSVHLPNT
ncbi:MAG: pseudouridine synthase [Pseudomonadales bacterium]|nr:pseudouridine synthase [Pseudomonadales bacterium]MDG1443947.1 pseudouridine synthase [Pseudomonadales bacterium]